MVILKNSFKSKFLHTVSNTILKYGMLQPEDSVLIGVSGGADSIALAHVLKELSPRFFLKLGIAHLNHCLRGEDSDKDAEFAAEFAKKMDIPCFIGIKDVETYRRNHKLSLEEAARELRYSFYHETAEKGGFNRIALGHHADDNAELVLMYLLRGSGPLGISGIQPVRDDKFIRPLIHVSRSEIKEFLKTKSQDYVTDISNSDIRYMRNRIRHKLIPDLTASYNPNITQTLNRLSSIIRSEEEWIEEMILPVFKRSILSSKKGKINLSVSELGRLPIGAVRRIIRKAIAQIKGNLRGITLTHIDDIAELLDHERDKKRLDLPDRIRITRTDNMLCISKEDKPLRLLNRKSEQDAAPLFEYSISCPGTLFIQETGVSIRFAEIKNLPDFSLSGQNTAFFDMERLSFPLTVRNFRPGDRFKPMGMAGTQKVKKYFINNKVSAAERIQCPVVLCRDKIIWLAGYRIDDTVKITPSSRKILMAELLA